MVHSDLCASKQEEVFMVTKLKLKTAVLTADFFTTLSYITYSMSDVF